jgi:hypothetical protein
MLRATGATYALSPAYELFGDDGLRGEADIALSTTRAAIASTFWPGRGFSLCHGLAGNADVLLEGAPGPR